MINLPELPYPKDALIPFLSAATLQTHYDKHHRGYATNLNNLIEDSDYAGRSLEEIVVHSKENGDEAVFNNAAQTFNHNFLWQSMTPKEQELRAPIADAVNASFESLDGFKAMFRKTAVSQFGSGWVWLVADGDGLKILSTDNAETPLALGMKPLLCLDVWEHAYYLDYKNDRASYAERFLENHVNWSFANENLDRLAAAA